MTTEPSGVMVYRDGDGNLYVRVPDEQKAAVEQALAEQDTRGFVEPGGGLGFGRIMVQGGLTPLGSIFQLSNPIASRGIIVIGGRIP